MKQALNPAVIAGILVVVVGIVAIVLFKGTSSGPVEGTKDTMPDVMKRAYGGAPPPQTGAKP